MKPITDYYCSEKFNQLSIDLSRLETFSCCTARAEKINFDWLKQNPNQIFNTPNLHNERMQMFSNQRVKSCDICWKAEEQGLSSRRQTNKSYNPRYNTIRSVVEYLEIVVGNHCNMSCVYCTKTYSSNWFRDIKINGEYLDGKYQRFQLNTKDLILNNISQKQITKSNWRKLLFDEIDYIVNTEQFKTITITGGEPFLFLNLVDLCNMVPDSKKIQIVTGLGVNENRFIKILNLLENKKNLEIVISGENTNNLYEFTRFGNTWNRFQQNLQLIKSKNIKHSFSIVISNLTIFGLLDFLKENSNKNNRFLFCNDPEFLNIKFLDDLSKQKLLDSLTDFPKEIVPSIEQNLNQQPEKEYIVDLRNYLIDFSTRRKLSLDIFPKSFLDWLENNSK